MIYTRATKRAMQICFEAHKDQLDKSGIPYVFHPIHLAEQMQDENTTVAAPSAVTSQVPSVASSAIITA